VWSRLTRTIPKVNVRRISLIDQLEMKLSDQAMDPLLNDKFRNECLNQHWFSTMDEAIYEINSWREHYNNVRPYSSLNYLPPVKYTKLAA